MEDTKDNSPSSLKRKAPSKVFGQLEYFCAGRKGLRHTYEDAHCCLGDLRVACPSECSVKNIKWSNNIEQAAFFAIFDGHGGSRAANRAAQDLPRQIAKSIQQTADGTNIEAPVVKKWFASEFAAFDEAYCAEAKGQTPPWRDGCTAICTLILDETIYVAGIGDARAVLCRRKKDAAPNDKAAFSAIQLSVDHKPHLLEERKRIERSGGRVDNNGRLNGILETVLMWVRVSFLNKRSIEQVSRAFGDFELKQSGLTSTPELRKFQVSSNDEFIIAACDGLWKVLTNVEAVALARRLFMAGQGAKAVCNELLRVALEEKEAKDNVTVMVIRIGDVPHRPLTPPPKWKPSKNAQNK